MQISIYVQEFKADLFHQKSCFVYVFFLYCGGYFFRE